METENQGITESSHKDLHRMLKKNSVLLAENNTLLKKIHRNAVWGFWVRVAWYFVLIGLPFALYFYVLEPYFTAMGSSYDTFNAGMREIPGVRQINEILQGGGGE